MKEHSEGFFKAKEMVDAIRDIDYLLENYDYGIQVLDSGVKKDSVREIFNHIRYIFGSNKKEYTNFVEAKSQLSSEFMVDLYDFFGPGEGKIREKIENFGVNF